MNTIKTIAEYLLYLYFLIAVYGETGHDKPALMFIITYLIFISANNSNLITENFKLIKKLHDVNKSNSKALTLMNDNNKDLMHSVSKLLILLKKEKNSLWSAELF